MASFTHCSSIVIPMHTPHQAGKRTCEDEEQLISLNLSHAEGKVGIKTLKKGNEIIAPSRLARVALLWLILAKEMKTQSARICCCQ